MAMLNVILTGILLLCIFVVIALCRYIHRKADDLDGLMGIQKAEDNGIIKIP